MPLRRRADLSSEPRDDMPGGMDHGVQLLKDRGGDVCGHVQGEAEIGVLMGHRLPRRMVGLEEMTRLAKAWKDDRNARQHTVDWQFTTEDAWVKPKHHYQI